MKNLFSIIFRLTLFVLVMTCAFEVSGQTPNQTKQAESGETETMKVLALRLKPGQDLRQQIEAFMARVYVFPSEVVKRAAKYVAS